MEIGFSYKDKDGYHITCDEEVIQLIKGHLMKLASQDTQGNRGREALRTLHSWERLADLLEETNDSAE